MTSRLLAPNTSPEPINYDTLIAEALDAFERDVMYSIQVVESARHTKKTKPKNRR